MGLQENIVQARKFLELAAFQVSAGNELPEAHRNIVKALVSLEEMERMLNSRHSSNNEEMQEVSKVTRRLKLWAKRPEQMNTRILKTFLLLSTDTRQPVIESQLKAAVGEANFDVNFVQMKNIAEKNHGKVFDVTGDKITIWPPVSEAVEEFRRTVITA